MDAVLALYRELRPHDPPLARENAARLWARISDGAQSLVVVGESEGRIGATCMLALIANLASGGRPIGFIEHVVTAADLRRRGLAEACLRFALEQAWQLGCCKVVLLSGALRPQAHRVYEKLGFDGDVERGFVIKRPAD
ncbi:GNAT family N-acetyltransferase [Variovorax sp. OV329]|uniref:GNAT family N-acetyltransferase n=1 Tax=Variovorax sp. OV329 TaxID=1882825 RepID=UPI0020C8CFCF|nr:GNAT family N-acetyltransferase [Variovorax sp. OV329]